MQMNCTSILESLDVLLILFVVVVKDLSSPSITVRISEIYSNHLLQHIHDMDCFKRRQISGAMTSLFVLISVVREVAERSIQTEIW